MRTRLRALARWLAIGLGGLVALAVALPLVLLAVGIQVDASRFAPVLAARGSAALGRELRLAGPIYVVPSYWPTLEVHDVSIADPYGGEGAEFARFARARVVVSLMSLLRGRIALVELSADGVQLHLVRYANGSASWAFGPPAAEPEAVRPTPEAPAEAAGPRILEAVEELALRDVELTWRDEASGAAERLTVKECLGTARRGKPLHLTLHGAFRGEPFRLHLGAGHLADLLTAHPELPLDLELELAGARLEIALQLDAGDPVAARTHAAQALGRYRLTFAVDRLDRLDRALRLALPPLGPVELRAEARIGRGEWNLHTLRLGVGETHLVGSASIAEGAERPLARFELTSDRFRIDDFLAEGWSAGRGSTAESKASPEAPAPAGEPRVLLDPQVMRLLDAQVHVQVDEVVSRDEPLGGGELRAELADGRFRLDPLRIDLPGGSLQLDATLQVDPGRTRAHAAFRTAGFDLGVLARRAAPDSTMGGTLDVDMGLDADAPQPTALMAHANGHFDLSLEPQNLQAGVIDLWAVNLVASVLPVVSGDDSTVNCVVALLDLEDGIMTSKSLLIDTSRIQVGGRVTLDFRKRHVSALLQPRPKRPQIFALSTPVTVEGDFDDFGVGVSARDLVGTAIRVVTDLATYPGRLLFVRPLPKDGRQACALARSREALEKASP